MITVLVVGDDGAEPQTGYWDGDEWYATCGDPIASVSWWALLPATP